MVTKDPLSYLDSEIKKILGKSFTVGICNRYCRWGNFVYHIENEENIFHLGRKWASQFVFEPLEKSKGNIDFVLRSVKASNIPIKGTVNGKEIELPTVGSEFYLKGEEPSIILKLLKKLFGK